MSINPKKHTSPLHPARFDMVKIDDPKRGVVVCFIVSFDGSEKQTRWHTSDLDAWQEAYQIAAEFIEDRNA